MAKEKSVVVRRAVAGDLDPLLRLYSKVASEPGGLGLYLVLKMADTIHYEYRDRTSKITFTNTISAGEAENNV